MFLSSSNHGGYHWRKCQERGIPLQAALVIGAPPCVSYTAPARIPFSVSELDVAGGLAGAPIEVVKCITNDVLVPANAEIVIEGEISTEFLEPEAPFGESTGYIAERLLNPYFEVKCITHRKNPIFATIISQMPPSESSVMRQVAAEGNYLRFLRDQCNIPGIIEVAFHSIAVRQICVIKMKKINQAHVWQALHSMVGYNPATGKMVIAVDDDINPRNLDSLFWAHGVSHAAASRRADHPQSHAADGPVGISAGTGSGAFAWTKSPALRDAHRRDAQVGLSAGVAAEERIHGARQTALGAARAAEAQAAGSVVRLQFRLVVGRRRGRGASSRSKASTIRPARSACSSGCG